jgi:hypothetical protein
VGEFLSYILAGYNVWFTAPIVFVFLFAILQLILGNFDLEGAEADVDADVDIDVDAGVDANADAEADLDAAGASGGGGFLASVFGFLNIGKVPLMVVLMTLLSIWGITGLAVNEFLGVGGASPRLGITPQAALSISFVAAFLCSVFGTRYVALGISKLFPESEHAVTYEDLVGLTGRVISGRVTPTFGTARVQTPNGAELTISCRILQNEDPPLKGDAVILVDYDPRSKIFDVTRTDDSLDS